MLASLLAMLLVATTPVEPQTVGWDELVERIERTSPLMSAASSGLDRLKHTMSRANWAYFPSFRLEGGGAPVPEVTRNDVTNDIEVDFETWGYLYRVSLTMAQPIYTFGKIAGLSEAARHGLDVGQAQIDIAKWELRVRASQAYYGALLARELDALFVEGKRWLDKAEARMKRLRDEDSEDYDQLAHLRLKSRVADFWQMEASNRALYTTSHEGLRVLLSLPTDQPVRPKEDALKATPVTLRSVEEYLAVAERSTPGIRVVRSAAAAKAGLADAAEAAVWPDLVLVGELSSTDSNVIKVDGSVPGSRSLGFAAGFLVGLRWELDVPQRIFRGREARAQAQQLMHQATAARDMMEVEVRRLRQQLEDGVRLIEVTHKSMVAARGWLTASWDLYDSGFGGFKDVMDALVQFYGKKVGYLKTVHEQNLRVVEMSRVIGHDITTLSAPSP